MGEFRLSASLRGHEADVRNVVFPSPRAVVSCSRDSTVRQWELTADSPPAYSCAIKASHAGEFVNSLAVVPPTDAYPEGLIVSGGKDQIIHVRQPARNVDDDAEALLIGHGANVCALDVSPDGRHIISGGWDQCALVWTVGSWGDKPVELQGHTASVWAVLAYDDSTIITGCADEQIRIFEPSGKQVRSIKTAAVVRALCRLPAGHPSGGHFASAGNDAVIRIWTLDGRQVQELHGHEAFIYSLAALPEGQLVSSGEDRTVRIWSSQQCIQTITHPAISVWSVAACTETGDIVTGASDNIVRVFTRAPERFAGDAAIAQFNDDVRSSAIPQQSLGNINKEQLPGPDFLTQKSGTKEGQVQMIHEADGSIAAYQWSTAANQWVNVGTVVDQAGSSGRKISHEGKEYDYVFDVDVEEGKPPLKLPYNLSQNPYEVARKFCEDNKLPITYLDQVTNFIVQNTQGATLGQTTGQGADPWGTESRYRPGDASASPPPPPPPAPRPSILPQKTYLDILTANHAVILKKMKEFNQKLVDDGHKDLSLNPADLEELDATIDALSKGKEKELEPTGIDLIVKAATQWPEDKRLPALDFLRLLFAYSIPVTYLTLQQSILQLLESSGVFASSSPPNNTMMAVRSISNLFRTEEGRAVATDEFDRLHKLVQPFIASSHKNLLIAVTTLYTNYAVLLSSNNNADRALTLLDDLSKLLSNTNGDNPEAAYRALVATGTLLSLGPDFCEAGRDVFQIDVAIQRAEEKVKEPRVKHVVGEIREKLKE